MRDSNHNLFSARAYLAIYAIKPEVAVKSGPEEKAARLKVTA